MQKGAPASRLPTPTNTLPSKPKKDTYAPTFHKPYAALIIETSHHALPSHSKHIFCTVEFCTVDCAQSNLPIRWSTLHLQIHALQRTVNPQTRHIERHTPHVSLHRMSKTLETHPQPNTSFPMGSVLPLSQHTHCTSKLSVSACRSKPLRIHPPACRNSWRHTHPHKHPFQWGVLQRIKPSIWHRHHGPITSYYAPQVEMLL